MLVPKSPCALIIATLALIHVIHTTVASSMVSQSSATSSGGLQLSLLGEGGFANVYKATDGEKTYALKVQKRAGSGETKSFQNEIEVMKDIAKKTVGESHVIFTYGDGSVTEEMSQVNPDLRTGQCYAKLPLFDGDLHRFARALSRKVDDQSWLYLVWEVVRQTSQGLQQLHSMGYSHRDVKPQNIFVMKTADTLTISKKDGKVTGLYVVLGDLGEVTKLQRKGEGGEEKEVGGGGAEGVGTGGGGAGGGAKGGGTKEEEGVGGGRAKGGSTGGGRGGGGLRERAIQELGGTPQYWPPEDMSYKGDDGGIVFVKNECFPLKSKDAWGLGVVAVELFLGRDSSKRTINLPSVFKGAEGGLPHFRFGQMPIVTQYSSAMSRLQDLLDTKSICGSEKFKFAMIQSLAWEPLKRSYEFWTQEVPTCTSGDGDGGAGAKEDTHISLEWVDILSAMSSSLDSTPDESQLVGEGKSSVGPSEEGRGQAPVAKNPFAVGGDGLSSLDSTPDESQSVGDGKSSVGPSEEGRGQAPVAQNPFAGGGDGLVKNDP